MQWFAEIKNYHDQPLSRSKILKNVPVLSPSEAKGGDVKVEEPEEMTLAMFDVKNLLENDDEDLNDHQQETVIDKKKSASEIPEDEIKSSLSSWSSEANGYNDSSEEGRSISKLILRQVPPGLWRVFMTSLLLMICSVPYGSGDTAPPLDWGNLSRGTERAEAS